MKEAPHAVITGIFTGAISARRLACFWRNGQIIDGVLRLPRLASNKMNLSNQEETHQFKFLVVLSIVVKEAPHAVITGIFTGAISARRLAWFWRNGQIIVHPFV
ncbi:MAG: hypothetical protein KFE24_01600 [Wolbachia endosymbiont of Homalodisca vitripennis]|nr:hypothetical protein [Wolbachia endosymbiont of Homalodisca vitripennis]